MLTQWCSNIYMIPELTNKYIWWQVVSVLVSLAEYHKSKVCPALMYIQHRHMVCGEWHTCHDLVLDQNVNDNSYSTPLIHKVLDTNHKMIILGIGWYHNKFSHLCVQHQHYPEHDTLCLYILFYWIFSCISLINDYMFTILLIHMFLDFFSQTVIICLYARMH